MQINSVTLTGKEVDTIYNECIKRFDPYKAKISEAESYTNMKKCHEIDFKLDDLTVYASLRLVVYYYDKTEQNMPKASEVSVIFIINLFHNGLAVEGLEKTEIYDRVNNYDWLKHFRS